MTKASSVLVDNSPCNAVWRGSLLSLWRNTMAPLLPMSGPDPIRCPGSHSFQKPAPEDSSVETTFQRLTVTLVLVRGEMLKMVSHHRKHLPQSHLCIWGQEGGEKRQSLLMQLHHSQSKTLLVTRSYWNISTPRGLCTNRMSPG